MVTESDMKIDSEYVHSGNVHIFAFEEPLAGHAMFVYRTSIPQQTGQRKSGI